MRKQFMGMILVLMALWLVAAEEKTVNLLKNPSFENTKPKKHAKNHKYNIEWLSGWSAADWGGKPTDGSKRGKVGLKTHSDASHGKASGHLYSTGEKRKNLVILQSQKNSGKEQNYLLTFKFKKVDSENDDDVKVYASYRTSGKSAVYIHSMSKLAVDKWQTMEFPFTVNADAKYFRIMLRATGGILFDEVVLQKED